MSRAPFGGGFMQGGRSPIGSAIERAAGAFAQFFQAQGEQKMQLGLDAKAQAKAKRDQIKELLESQDGPQDENQRSSLTMLLNQYEGVMNSDPRQAMELFTGIEEMGIEIPKLETVQIPGVGGGTDQAGKPAQTEASRTVFDEVDPDRFVADMVRQENVSERERVEARENEINLTPKEQSALYTQMVPQVEEFVQSGQHSDAEIAEFINTSGLTGVYQRQLLSRANMGAVTDIGSLAQSNPGMVAANLQQAMQRDGSFDESKLPAGYKRFVDSNPGFARQLVQRNQLAMQGLELDMSAKVAEVAGTWLQNDVAEQNLRKGDLSIEQLQVQVGQLEFASGSERVTTTFETGNLDLYGKLSDSEKTAVERMLRKHSGTPEASVEELLAERSGVFGDKVHALQRQAVLANTATEVGTDLSRAQVSAAEYANLQEQSLGLIKDQEAIQELLFTAAQRGDASRIEQYQKVMKYPRTYPEQHRALVRAGFTAARLDDLHDQALVAAGDDEAVRAWESEVRDAKLNQALTDNLVSSESVARDIASTFDSAEDLAAFKESNPDYFEMLPPGVAMRVEANVHFNELLKGKAEAQRDIEFLTENRPENLEEWDRALFIKRMGEFGVSAAVAGQRADALLDAWGRGASKETLEIEQTRAQMALWGAQGQAAIANARTAQRNATTAERNAAVAEGNAASKADQTTWEQTLKATEFNRKQLDDTRQTITAEMEANGCFESTPVGRALRTNPGEACEIRAQELAAVKVAQADNAALKSTLTADGAGLFLPAGSEARLEAMSDEDLVDSIAETMITSGGDLQEMPPEWSALVARVGTATAEEVVRNLILKRSGTGGGADEGAGGTVFEGAASEGAAE